MGESFGAQEKQTLKSLPAWLGGPRTLSSDTREKLQEVIRVLGELPAHCIVDMCSWRTRSTTACAIGWAADDSWFRKNGLLMSGCHPTYRINDLNASLYDYDAVGAFFSLTFLEVLWLFSGRHYPIQSLFVDKLGQRAEVISRIQTFLKLNN